jgi:TolB protein
MPAACPPQAGSGRDDKFGAISKFLAVGSIVELHQAGFFSDETKPQGADDVKEAMYGVGFARTRAITFVVLACALVWPGGRTVSGADERLGLFDGYTDVGSTPKAGSASYDSRLKEYTVTGGGANMWGTEDAFHYVWARVSGDITIAASVSLQGTTGNEHRKAGLMIRQGLGASDAHADVLIHGDGLTALQYREKPGAETREVRSEMASPAFVRLERRGNTYTLYIADEGRHFTKVGSVEVELQDPVYVGLAVCSHDADALQTAVFRKVELKARR